MSTWEGNLHWLSKYLDQIGLGAYLWGIALVANWCEKMRSIASGTIRWAGGPELYKTGENYIEAESKQHACMYFFLLLTVIWLAVSSSFHLAFSTMVNCNLELWTK